MPALVTLTTDFGQREPSAAELKGILYCGCPGVQVVDLSHEIARGDLMEAAFFVLRSVPRFPQDTIHLVDVAPGPGPVIISVLGQQIICPDNGLATMLSYHHSIDSVHQIEIYEDALSRPGQVYFGRDVFAPAAVQLANGSSPSEMGGRVDAMKLLDIARPERVDDRLISGVIIHVDRFGNLVTNIHNSDLKDCSVRKIEVGVFPIHKLSNSYAEVPQGSPLALLGSAGYLEIAFNGDRADNRLQLGCGIKVRVSIDPA